MCGIHEVEEAMDERTKNILIARAIGGSKRLYLESKLLDSIIGDPLFGSMPLQAQEYFLGVPPDTPQDRYTLEELKEKFGITEEDIETHKQERREQREKILEKGFAQMVDDAEDEEERSGLLQHEEEVKQYIADVLLMEDPDAAEKFMKEEYPEILGE